MKVRDCTRCRQQIAKAVEDEFLKSQYAIYNDMAYTFAVMSTAAVLGVMYHRGRSKEYIQKLFKDICFMYDYPKIMGKGLDLDGLINILETECGINFDEIKLNLETENQFITSAKKRRKRNGRN